MAFVIQLYPLINEFWTKVQLIGSSIQGTAVGSFNDSNYTWAYFLNRNSTIGNYENHIIEAFRCAIALAVAYSCILGRVGSFECWLLVVLGTFGFELNRQILYGLYQKINSLSGDPFGTMNVFTFGGFMGLGAGIILSCR